MERGILILSSLFYALACAGLARALRRGARLAPAAGDVMIAAGVACQTLALWVRAQRIGHCPVTNLFEILIFLAWSIGLVHLAIGPTYRLSILGAFTAPVVLVIHGIALAAPVDPARLVARAGVWVELHATLSVLSYGVFAIAGVTGLVYLVQDRQLKRRQARPLLFALPPVSDLWVANQRLLLVGFGLFTLGLASGFAAGRTVSGWKLASGTVVWAVYGTILALRAGRALGPRKVAALSAAAFGLALASLWGANLVAGEGGV